MEEIEGGREVFAQFQKFCKESSSVHAKRLQRIKEDLEVASGKAFLDEDLKSRPAELPQIGFDYLRPYANYLINQYREKPFGIVVSDRSEGSNVGAKTQTIIRGIERASRAVQAYITAIDRQIKCGLGFFLVTNDWSSESEGFNQDLKIVAIERPDMVIDCTFSKAIDGGDAIERALANHLPVSVAKELYGEDVITSKSDDMACFGTAWSPQVDYVAEITYFKLRKTKSNIFLDDAGEVQKEEDVRANSKAKKNAKKSRTVTKTECDVYKIVGQKVVSKTTLPCSYIPLIAVRGEMIDKDGKIDWAGITYFAKPILRMMSYYLSEAAIRINKSPRSIIVADATSIAPYQQILASGLPTTIMPFNSRDPSDKDISYPPPSLLNVAIDVSDLAAMHEKCKADLSSVLGMSEAGILAGQRQNQTATEVLTRQKSQDLSNFQFLDNFSESLKLGGRVMAQLLNTVYDTERLVPIEENGKLVMKSMNVSQLGIDPEKIGIEVDSGPMSATSKKEDLYKVLAIAELSDEIDRKKLLPTIAKLSDIESADGLVKTLTGNFADAEGALASAEQAVSSLEQTVKAMEENQSQTMLYIQQLQGENMTLKADKSADIYKTDMHYKETIDLQLLKQEGSLTETQIKLQADANNALIESKTRYIESINAKPEITIVSGARPDMTAIGGQRNDIFNR